MKKNLDRRGFLKLGMGVGVGSLGLLVAGVPKAAAEMCGLTPPQTPGPFYPGEASFHNDSDLTLIQGHAQRAQGQIIYIEGKVVDPNCKAIEGANVEIWQACESGKYNNPRDPNPAPLDPDFKYWGETYTDTNGSYLFKTILPGAYPADTNWTRPSHIHYKVTKLGYRELVTQMYFKGDPHNDEDLILQQLPPEEREKVIVEFKKAPLRFIEGREPDALLGVFDITLRPIR